MTVLKLILVPYFCLGMFTAGAIHAAYSKRLAWHPGFKLFAILAAIHLLLIGASFFLTSESNRKGTRLSPAGMVIGLALAYFAGVLLPFLV